MCNMDQQLRQLIQILSIAIRCGNLTGDETQFTANIQQVLQIVLTNNLTSFTSGGVQEGLGQNQSQSVGHPNPYPNVGGLYQNFGFGTGGGNGSSDSAISNNISGDNRGGNETGVLFSAVSPFARSFLPIPPPSTTGLGAGAQNFGFGFGNTTTSSDIALIVPNVNGVNVTPVNSSIFSGGYGGPGGMGGPIFPGGPSQIEIKKMQESSNSHRLHRLEIIKVVVLIVVISIILISTCRMVLQLFLRFRPEKNHDYI